MIVMLVLAAVVAATVFVFGRQEKKKEAAELERAGAEQASDVHIKSAPSTVPVEDEGPEYEMSYYSGGKSKMRFINTFPPKGYRRLVTMNCPVAGVNYYWESVASYEGGKLRRVDLVREPDNPHDPFAYAVFGTWIDKYGRRRREQLGHLPAAVSKSIVQERPSDLPIKAVPASIYNDGDFTELKLAIFEPDRHSEFWKERGGAPEKLGTTINN